MDNVWHEAKVLQMIRPSNFFKLSSPSAVLNLSTDQVAQPHGLAPPKYKISI
jgi:hypothetical protein